MKRRVTYTDLAVLLKAHGFERAVEPGVEVRYRHPGSPARLLLPVEPDNAAVEALHLAMVKRMLVDFGFMEEKAVDRWIANPASSRAA